MINNKNNWYRDAQTSSDIFLEAGMSDTFKKLTLAVGLVLSGIALLNVSQQTGISPEQIQQALNNQQIVELAQQNRDFTPFETVNVVNSPEQPIQPEEVNHDPNALNFSAIENLLRLHEVSGAKRMVTVRGEQIDIRKVYPDPIYGMKVPTIGVGYNLNRSEAKSEIESLGLNYENIRNGTEILTDDQVNALYRNDIGKSLAMARKFLKSFEQQPTDVKTVIADMAFNLGETRLAKFKNFRQALEDRNYSKAADEMRNSIWATQVGDRADRLENMIRNISSEEIETNVPEKIENNIPENPINYN